MTIELHRGTNFSHWLSQTDITDEEGLRTRIVREDFRRMRECGADHVRLPVDYRLIESPEPPHGPLQSGLEHVDRAVEWAREVGLNIIIDLHEAPGMSFHTPETNEIWTRRDLQERFAAIWRALAQHYERPDCDHVAFELVNEPTAEEPEDWNRIAALGLAAVREVSAERTILIGSNSWSVPATFESLRDFGDPEVIYTCHFYEPFIFTHQRAPWVDYLARLDMEVEYPTELPDLSERAAEVGSDQLDLFSGERLGPERMERCLRPAVEFCREADAPLHCGEFGVYKVAPVESQLRWYGDVVELFARHQVSWSNWDYRGGFGLFTPEGRERPILPVLFP